MESLSEQQIDLYNRLSKEEEKEEEAWEALRDQDPNDPEVKVLKEKTLLRSLSRSRDPETVFDWLAPDFVTRQNHVVPSTPVKSEVKAAVIETTIDRDNEFERTWVRSDLNAVQQVVTPIPLELDNLKADIDIAANRHHLSTLVRIWTAQNEDAKSSFAKMDEAEMQIVTQINGMMGFNLFDEKVYMKKITEEGCYTLTPVTLLWLVKTYPDATILTYNKEKYRFFIDKGVPPEEIKMDLNMTEIFNYKEEQKKLLAKYKEEKRKKEKQIKEAEAERAREEKKRKKREDKERKKKEKKAKKEKKKKSKKPKLTEDDKDKSPETTPPTSQTPLNEEDLMDLQAIEEATAGLLKNTFEMVAPSEYEGDISKVVGEEGLIPFEELAAQQLDALEMEEPPKLEGPYVVPCFRQNIFTFWSKHPHCMKYLGTTFNPLPWGIKEKDLKKCNYLDFWGGHRYHLLRVSKFTDWDKISLILNHIRYAWADHDSDYFQVLYYFAAIIQCPWERRNKAMAAVGEQGHGKTMIMRLLNEIIGQIHSILATSKDDVFGRFTSILVHKIFVFIDEITELTEEQMSTFKNLITGDFARIRKLFEDTIVKMNRANFVCAANPLNTFIAKDSPRNRRMNLIHVDANPLMNHAAYKEMGFKDLEEYGAYFDDWVKADDGLATKTFANFLWHFPLHWFKKHEAEKQIKTPLLFYTELKGHHKYDLWWAGVLKGRKIKNLEWEPEFIINYIDFYGDYLTWLEGKSQTVKTKEEITNEFQVAIEKYFPEDRRCKNLANGTSCPAIRLNNIDEAIARFCKVVYKHFDQMAYTPYVWEEWCKEKSKDNKTKTLEKKKATDIWKGSALINLSTKWLTPAYFEEYSIRVSKEIGTLEHEYKGLYEQAEEVRLTDPQQWLKDKVFATSSLEELCEKIKDKYILYYKLRVVHLQKEDLDDIRIQVALKYFAIEPPSYEQLIRPDVMWPVDLIPTHISGYKAYVKRAEEIAQVDAPQARRQKNVKKLQSQIEKVLKSDWKNSPDNNNNNLL